MPITHPTYKITKQQDSNSDKNIIIKLAQFQKQKLIATLQERTEEICVVMSQGVFSHVVILNLGFNNIQSIERLVCLDMPQLRQLHLFNNCLTTIYSLRRANLPKLQYLNLAQNKVTNIKGISEGHFRYLDQIWAYDNEIQEGRELLKLESPVRACLLGSPDFYYPLQIQLKLRCFQYQPVEINIYY